MTNLDKLRALLEELFQLDQADLDFGIYRIMNQKREEIVRFLNNDLLPQVKEAFKQYKPADKAELQAQLQEAVKQADQLGVNPEDTKKVKELRQRLADNAVDVTGLEDEVFSHLYNFFRRYYSEGDFISLRRYKAGVYAIPYEGEEVKLHWANADQYYVKSSETFRDYTFKVSSGKRVRVHLVAASTEQDNNKPAPGNERRFVLKEDEPLREENGDLYIQFEYRPTEDKEKQDALNRQAIETVLAAPGFEAWAKDLGKADPTDTKGRTVLERHLTQYTAKNTFDYFIHKDLGGFLRRELDFYIKNEVMHLDDIEHASAPRVEQYLSQIKVMRAIAHKIIQFLEQLENFQKKMWLKKKFVVETNYCVTLDRVPVELYDEIANNEAQREEWVRLFAIDEIKKDLNGPGYSRPLTPSFLKSQSHLVLDTAYFTPSFKDRLLSSIDRLDDSCDGVIVHAENFQCLALMQTRYQGQIQCVFVDPPYNTGTDVFNYKDNYQHSSWAAMVNDRLTLCRSLLSLGAAIFQTIDDGEVSRLRLLTDLVFGEDNFVAALVWQKRYVSNSTAKFVSDMHDYILMHARQIDNLRISLEPRSDEQLKAYKNPDSDPRGRWRAQDLSASKPYYAGLYEIVTPAGLHANPPPGRYWRCSREEYDRLLRDNRITFGASGEGRPMLKAFLSEAQEGVVPNTWWSRDQVGDNKEAKLHLKDLFFPEPPFATPKPGRLVERCIELLGATKCLDYFAGSGTTGEAVINLVRKDKRRRQYFLVESGRYFDSILKPRLQKVMYSSKWKEGKPASRDGISHMFKYIRLESYDDALSNLELKRSGQQGSLLEEDPQLREQYLLSYMLNVESRGSQSLLNTESFRNPDDYKLRVERNGETQLVNVDLVETFNWLLGLTVKHIDLIRGVRVVEGTNPQGGRVLVLWRNLDEMDNDKLDKWFEKQGYSTRDLEYDLVYVNGDNNLENLRRADQTWKVRLIEEEFQRLMFDVQDV